MRHANFLALVLAIVTVTSFATAQITIHNTDCYGPGTELIDYSASGVSFNVGSAGANQTWTVGTYSWSDTTHTSVVDPASTPFAASFPTATRATGDSQDGIAVYAFERIAPDGFYMLGIGMEMGGQQVIIPTEPVTMQAPLPLTMGANWTTVMRMSIMGQVMAADSSLRTVDAWGTINTPFGSHPVLRIWDRSWDLTDMSISASYVWINQQGSPIVEMSNSDQSHNPNFTFGDVDLTVLGTVGTDPVRGPVAERFLVGQNYPNPFNPNTTLPVELSKQCRVDVTIYDETGRQVSTQSFELSAGQHSLPVNGSAWSTGTYFARVSADGVQQTTKMQLVK